MPSENSYLLSYPKLLRFTESPLNPKHKEMAFGEIKRAAAQRARSNPALLTEACPDLGNPRFGFTKRRGVCVDGMGAENKLVIK
jgi:hypothetical protein